MSQLRADIEVIDRACEEVEAEPVEALAECDVGHWEGLDWQTLRYLDAGRTTARAVNDTSHLASLALAYAPPRPAG